MKWRWMSFMLVVVLGLIAVVLWVRSRTECRFLPQIREAAGRYHVDPLLVKAVVWQESRFRPETRGRHGELGLMQLQDVAAQEWADAERLSTFEHEHCSDPGTNLLAGTYYLGKLLKRYRHTDNPVPYALADYNAGRGNLLKWNGGPAATNSAAFVERIGFPGTKAYVKAVMRRHALYRWLHRLGLG